MFHRQTVNKRDGREEGAVAKIKVESMKEGTLVCSYLCTKDPPCMASRLQYGVK